MEIYVDNYDDPQAVSETVKDYHVILEHADSVTCITTEDSDVIKKLRGFKILHVRGNKYEHQTGQLDQT